MHIEPFRIVAVVFYLATVGGHILRDGQDSYEKEILIRYARGPFNRQISPIHPSEI